MRVMVIVKATRDSGAGFFFCWVRPDPLNPAVVGFGSTKAETISIPSSSTPILTGCNPNSQDLPVGPSRSLVSETRRPETTPSVSTSAKTDRTKSAAAVRAYEPAAPLVTSLPWWCSPRTTAPVFSSDNGKGTHDATGVCRIVPVPDIE